MGTGCVAVRFIHIYRFNFHHKSLAPPLPISRSPCGAAMDKQRNVIDSYNITGYNVSNVGNVTNITVSHPMGSSSQHLFQL